MGYKFQFVTLGGFHALNLGMFELALGYLDEGMAAYSRLQELEFARERDSYRGVKHRAFVNETPSLAVDLSPEVSSDQFQTSDSCAVRLRSVNSTVHYHAPR
jgi:isocitrate lyase